VEPGYWVKRLDEVPLVPTDDPDDFDWYPIQHHFGLGAFGVNAFGGEPGIELVAEHDETESGQEEVYVVLAGAAQFTLAGDDVDGKAMMSETDVGSAGTPLPPDPVNISNSAIER